MKDAQGHGSDGAGGKDISHQTKVQQIGRTLGAFMRDTSGEGKVIPGAEHLLEHMKEDPQMTLHLGHLFG